MATILSADRAYYDQAVTADDIAPFVRDIQFYYQNWQSDRRRWFGRRSDVRILELGAGSCTVSYLLSREPWAAEIVACDISLARAEQFRPHVERLVGGDPSKVSLVEADMNGELPFAGNSFDLVVMDSALHHSRSIWLTLSEVHRVLKPGGHFVAQREQYVAPLTAWLKFYRLLRTDEVRQGVSENAYLKEQYDFYLRAHGFRPSFRPVYPRAIFRGLSFLNGLAFAKFNIVACRELAEPRALV